MMKTMVKKAVALVGATLLLTSVATLLLHESASAEGLSDNCLNSYLGDPMPNTLISGIGYPVADVTIDSWVKNNNYAKMNQHSWDIWAALVEMVNDKNLGQVPRYETWKTPAQIVNNCSDGEPIILKIPKQFTHAGVASSSSGGGVGVNEMVLEGVRYSPSSARHAAKYDLFNKTALSAFYNAQFSLKVFPIKIPDFPAAAVNIKPVYKIFSKKDVAMNYLPIKVWSGLPSSLSAEGYKEAAWPDCVYIDFSNKSNPQNVYGEVCEKRKDSYTYNINDFIHIKITKKTLDNYRRFTSDQKLKIGDYLVLVAMHVSTRETTRWTWQTFFWTYNPAVPPLPSTEAKAKAQPKRLPNAGGHYAMANGYTTEKYPTSNGEGGYSMVWPAQPDLGGKSEGYGVVVFNPYLEAGFGTSIFLPNPKPIGDKYTAKVGSQSNCMSCHGMAYIKTTKQQAEDTPLGYVADYYYPLDDNIFEGYLKADFSWSIQSNAK